MATPASIARSLRLFLLIVGVCFALEWGLGGLSLGLHLKYPFTTPLWPWAERYHDFLDLVPRARVFPSMEVFTRQDLGLRFQYPSPCIYVFVFLVRCFPNATVAYLVSAVVIAGGAGGFLSSYLAKIKAPGVTYLAVWGTILLGMPLGFLIDSGNIEQFVWLLMMLGIVAFVRGWHYAAAVFLGIGGALKIYPLVLLLLFLPRRQYKAALLGGFVAVLLYFGAVAGFAAPMADVVREQKVNAAFMHENQIIQVAEGTIRFEHTLLSVYKQIVYWIYKATHHFEHGPHIDFSRAVAVYSWVAVGLFAGVYLGFVRRLPLLNQLIALTVGIVILPYISFEYTLVHLYTAFAAFLVFLVQDVWSGRSLLPAAAMSRIVVCFALLFSYVSALSLWRFEGQMKCVVLIVLLVVVLRTPMPSRLFGDLDGGLV